MRKIEKPLFAPRGHKLLERIAADVPSFKEVYMKSGMLRLFESYVALMLLSTVLTFMSAFVVGALLHQFLLKLSLYQYLGATAVFAAVISLFVPIAFIIYPLNRRSQRKKELETNLIYTTGYMTVLSAGGISIEKIFERVIQVERRRPIRDLARMIITDIRMFGVDVTSALGKAALRSPSETFSKLLMGITNTLKTSGDLKSLLSFETQRLLHSKREELKKTLNTLMAFGEVYITAIVIAPIVFVVMITILSVMGNVAFGISPTMQLNLLVFFGIPMLSLLFILMLNNILPEEE